MEIDQPNMFQTKIKEQSITRIVLLGQTGSGKSRVVNCLLNLTSESGFKESDEYDSCTEDTKAIEGNWCNLIDTPGIDDCHNRDTEHIKNIIEYLKKWKYINTFGSGKTPLLARMVIDRNQRINSNTGSTDKRLTTQYETYTVLVKDRNDKCKSCDSPGLNLNPSPTIAKLKELDNYLGLENHHQAKKINKFFQNISDLCEDAFAGKIPINLYTEENLMTIIDVFDLSCRENYGSKIMDKIECLKYYWYKMVREKEKKEETAERSSSSSRIFPGNTTNDSNSNFLLREQGVTSGMPGTETSIIKLETIMTKSICMISDPDEANGTGFLAKIPNCNEVAFMFKEETTSKLLHSINFKEFRLHFGNTEGDANAGNSFCLKDFGGFRGSIGYKGERRFFSGGNTWTDTSDQYEDYCVLLLTAQSVAAKGLKYLDCRDGDFLKCKPNELISIFGHYCVLTANNIEETLNNLEGGLGYLKCGNGDYLNYKKDKVVIIFGHPGVSAKEENNHGWRSDGGRQIEENCQDGVEKQKQIDVEFEDILEELQGDVVEKSLYKQLKEIYKEEPVVVLQGAELLIPKSTSLNFTDGFDSKPSLMEIRDGYKILREEVREKIGIPTPIFLNIRKVINGWESMANISKSPGVGVGKKLTKLTMANKTRADYHLFIFVDEFSPDLTMGTQLDWTGLTMGTQLDIVEFTGPVVANIDEEAEAASAKGYDEHIPFKLDPNARKRKISLREDTNRKVIGEKNSKEQGIKKEKLRELTT